MTDLGKCDIFLDMCTQRDYLLADGALPSMNAAQVRLNLKHLMAYARWAGVPTLSCVDVRRPDEVRGVPNPYCVLGTPGQLKIGFTLLPDRVVIESDNRLCVALDVLKHSQQAVFTKRHRDPFTNPKLDRLLTEMPARRFVVFGIALENSIRLLALGLLLRHRNVTLVQDACGFWSPEEADMSLRQIAAKDCTIVTTEMLIRSALARRSALPRPRARRRRFVA